MILVPLFDLKFLNELAAGGVGTSNRRHSSAGPGMRFSGMDLVHAVQALRQQTQVAVAAAHGLEHARFLRNRATLRISNSGACR